MARASPEDFVVVKVDIDTPAAELTIMEAIADRPEIAALVDEIFFEYHLRVDDASPAGAKCDAGFAQDAEGRCDTPADALELMTRLRRLGIRSHFWI